MGIFIKLVNHTYFVTMEIYLIHKISKLFYNIEAQNIPVINYLFVERLNSNNYVSRNWNFVQILVTYEIPRRYIVQIKV